MKKNNVQIALMALVACALSAYLLWRFMPPSFFYEYEWKPAQGLSRLVSTPLSAVVTITLIVMSVTALLYRLGSLVTSDSSLKTQCTKLIVSWAIPMAIAALACDCLTPSDAERNYQSLMVLAGREDWMGIGRLNQKHPATTHQEQNVVYLAYAHLGILPEHFGRKQQRVVEDLFVLEISKPEYSAMLSDIYWGMGEISMSQMYAFEANEKMDNRSPRLLKRLVQTNIVFGYYAVADKYLTILSQMGCDDAFVTRYKTLLTDEAVSADPLLSSKRLCIPAENGFPSTRSIPYDLQCILSQNPKHTVSLQYLKAIQML